MNMANHTGQNVDNCSPASPIVGPFVHGVMFGAGNDIQNIQAFTHSWCFALPVVAVAVVTVIVKRFQAKKEQSVVFQIKLQKSKGSPLQETDSKIVTKK
jgi:hypothetical protein